MSNRTLENIIITISILFGSLLIISVVINYDNSIKCEEKGGNWYLGKCLSKSDNIEIEL